MRSAIVLASLGLLAGCANLPGVYQRPATPVASVAAAIAPVVMGATAPDAVFFGQDGQRHVLSEYKGKFLALVFFAHW